MALPPTIPTSFIPHPSSEVHRMKTNFGGAFAYFAYFILSIVFVMAVGVFAYGHILVAEDASKLKEIRTLEGKIETNEVETFVKLRDRLSSSSNLLDKHVALSGFFGILEKILPTTVRFSSFKLSFEKSGEPKIEGSGSAKSFNSLANVSTAFASEARIKDAIFSGIKIEKDNSVSFTLVATMDPKVIEYVP